MENNGPHPEVMLATIAKTRELQNTRFHKEHMKTNGEMGPKEIQKYCPLSRETDQFMRQVVTTHNMSGRGFHKILKLARTIADLDGQASITLPHLAEAVGYRIQNEAI